MFLKRLALRLPFDSFRFDFRWVSEYSIILWIFIYFDSGNHESGGTWKQGALAEDYVDLETVVKYLKENFGYVVDMVVGHSRGSILAFNWLSTSEDGKKVSCFVNASGRYRMRVRRMVTLRVIFYDIFFFICVLENIRYLPFFYLC